MMMVKMREDGNKGRGEAEWGEQLVQDTAR